MAKQHIVRSTVPDILGVVVETNNTPPAREFDGLRKIPELAKLEAPDMSDHAPAVVTAQTPPF